jgi:hypothetical protein
MKRGAIAFLLILTFVFQGTTAVLAGTTGEISGIVVDASTNKPLAGVPVTASSPSQVATTRTDQYGRFAFISLAPDTYTVGAAKTDTHDPGNVSAVTVQADQQITVSIPTNTTLQTIGRVGVRAQSALVKPGTIVDVYSVSAVTQDKAAQLGGGGNLNSAWSALASVPGVFVTPGQMGYIGAGATLSIRGGDYDQIGYEFDGVPVNRSFDDYPSGTLSSLGQQELQVYTGSNPNNSQASGLSGYINQVIRTGTAPAYKTLTAATGFPAYYGKLAFETGGANPSRTFSYYLGLGAYNQDFRFFDPYNGASLSQQYGSGLIACDYTVSTPPSSCFGPHGADYTNGGLTAADALGPANIDGTHETQVRDTVFNSHFGIPKSDGTKDDVQVLLDIDHLGTTAYTSAADIGSPAFVNNLFGSQPFYLDGYQYSGKIGSVLDPTTAGGLVTPYLFPGSPTGRSTFANLPYNLEGSQSNDQNIFKLQYQHNIGTNAFVRVYGYTYYSDWLMVDPTAGFSEYYIGTFGAFSPDYELSSHARGGSIEFSDQLNSQHLLTIVGNYTTASTIRDNNTEWFNGVYGENTVNARTAIGVVVNAAAPTSGYCFSNAGVAVSCGYSHANTTGAQYLTLQQALAGDNLTLPATCALPGVASTTCEYLTVGNGEYATYNTVVPRFGAVNISDDWKPNDKLDISVSLREDQFQFATSSQNDNAARQLYYNSFNLFNCFAKGTPTVYTNTNGPGAACPAGQYSPNIINQNGGVTTYDVLQPRAGFTYSVNPSTVVRGSYGRYTQAPNSAFEQYDALQANQPYLLYNTYGFQQYGFTSSLHHVGPEISNNYDLSLEKSFGSDLSIKLTPFYRSTQGQIQQFFLSVVTGFVSGLNVGQQTSKGVEFELDKGDFSRNGLAAKLSFAYTNSNIRYTALSGGGTVLDPINYNIKQYNAYTSYCASNPNVPKCAGGTTQSGAAGAPCYTTTGAADPTCAAGDIANPYWNLPAEPLINTNSSFATYDILPGTPGDNGNAYGAPYVTTLLAQYKHNRFSITPALQLVQGQKYGTPETTYGVAPDLCTGVIPGTSRYDIATCGGTGGFFGNVPGYAFVVPDQQTGNFDSLGAFTEPSLLLLHVQASYDVNKRITLVGTFANLYHACFGGSKVPWSVGGACAYGPNNFFPIGNNYNPGNTIQPFLANTYSPEFNTLPFNAYVEARIKI